jgi:hypothetical protein
VERPCHLLPLLLVFGLSTERAPTSRRPRAAAKRSLPSSTSAAESLPRGCPARAGELQPQLCLPTRRALHCLRRPGQPIRDTDLIAACATPLPDCQHRWHLKLLPSRWARKRSQGSGGPAYERRAQKIGGGVS